MFHMQERQLLLSSLFKKPVHNAIRHFSCLHRNICSEYSLEFLQLWYRLLRWFCGEIRKIVMLHYHFY